MLRPELYSDILNLIISNAEAGKLCSETQLLKMAKALTEWRGLDVSNYPLKARLLWLYKRSTSFEEVLEGTGVSYKVFMKSFEGVRRDRGERAYWNFEDTYGASVLIMFSKYLTGSESLAAAGVRFGWSRQAVHQLIARIFGEKFSSFVKEITDTFSISLKKCSKAKRSRLQILKAGAALGDVKDVETLLDYGGGTIQFIQRPEALYFKSLTGKFKLLKGQKVSKGRIVIDISDIPGTANFVIVCVEGKFYKHNDITNPLVSSQSRIKFSQALSF